MIKCEANYPDYGAVYDSISIGFDIKGTAGTEYTFKIEIENEYDHMPWGYYNYFEDDPRAKMIATAKFLDPSGKEVEEFDYNTIQWSFASEYINGTNTDNSSFFIKNEVNNGKTYRFSLNTDVFWVFVNDSYINRNNYHGILKAKFTKPFTVNE